MSEPIFDSVRERGLELAKKIIEEVKKANLVVTEDMERWAKVAGIRIAEREKEVEVARKAGDKFLWKKNRDAFERVSFETAELSEIADIIRDKTILEVLKKGAKAVASLVITSLLAFG